MKTYLHQKDLNRHIMAVHDFVKHTCTRCLCSFTRQYNLMEHLLKDCVLKVGSAPVTRIQPLYDFLQGYKIPTLDPEVMPRYMNPTTVGDSTTTPLEGTTPPLSTAETPRLSTLTCTFSFSYHHTQGECHFPLHYSTCDFHTGNPTLETS